jgi:lysophospholipase L1-like esterase
MRSVFAVLIIFMPTTAAFAGEGFLLKDGQRVVFLGDSNTYAGKYIAYLDAYLCTRFPDKRFELINLGLPSETVSGLSEPDHPYPRPNIHDRVERALALAKPDVVVICYGMNDGIYYPFSEERFKKYQQGITNLVEKVEKAGAKAMLMSSPPFDATPLKGKVQAKGAEKFSWLRPYERYDEEVLTKYSEWLLTLRQKKYTVIDAHAALLKHLETMRKDEPAYRFSGDGIHPNANGHLVIALEILKEWQAPTAVKDIAIDVAKELLRGDKDPPTQPGVTITFVRRNSVSFKSSLPRPMPADPAWTPRVKEIEKFDARVNRYALKVEGLGGFLAIQMGNPKEGGKRVPMRGDEIAKGIDLAELLKITPDPKTPEIWKLIDEKNRVLGPAWLTHVGHKRPDTPKGMPFEEASRKAAALDADIRKLCAPTEISIGVGPFGK